MDNIIDQPCVLVWRDWVELTRSASLSIPKNRCKFCQAQLEDNEPEKICRLCGWGYSTAIKERFGDHYSDRTSRVVERILRAFRISSTKLALSELGTHLQKRFSDIYSLSPYRFEELIGDVFKQIGYEVEMTKKSRDGGVDLFLLSGEGHRLGIVQCKRYRKDRKVDISLVSQLLGTQLAFDVGLAVLVTTSGFTLPSVARARSTSLVRHGFEVNLIDATDLLRMLKVYNEEMPPLNEITHELLLSRGLVL